MNVHSVSSRAEQKSSVSEPNNEARRSRSRLFLSIFWTFALTAVAIPLFSQRVVVDPFNSYHRVYAIVPVVGSGSSADPVHPLYAPSALEVNPTTGILAFTSELSDDGKFALIELVALHRTAFTKLLADKSIVAFEKGSVAPAAIEAAFVKYKPSFHFSQFNEVPVR